MPAKPIKPARDWDAILAYKTDKVVRIKDAKLGLLSIGIRAAVVFYIIAVRFMLEAKHQNTEKGIGTVIVKLFGKAFIGARPIDAHELRFPVIEPTGAFIMTKRIRLLQRRGQCIDWDIPKRCPCGVGEVCQAPENEFCAKPTWCPSVGDYNIESLPPEAVVEEVVGLEHMVLSITAAITFPSLGNDLFTSDSKAVSKFKNITLHQLLGEVDPPLRMDDINSNGAVIGISFNWDCNVYAECEPEVIIKRLDGTTQGFVQKRSSQKTVSGENLREVDYMYGIRILVNSQGLGKQLSFMLFMLEIGSGLALLKTASIITDLMMLKSPLYETQRRAKFYECKVTETKDYSDVNDRITLILDEKEKMKAQGMSFFGVSMRRGRPGSDS